MATNDDSAEGSRADKSARLRPKGSDRPFDMWLHKQLHAMYDEIASEPLPEDLLNLIEKDAVKNGKKVSSSDEPSKK
jgi:hypothetical protein